MTIDDYLVSLSEAISNRTKGLIAGALMTLHGSTHQPNIPVKT